MDRRTVIDRLRRILVPILLLIALLGFGALTNRHQRIAEWLFPRYAGYSLLALLFAAACFSSGHLVVRRVLGGRVLPLLEHLAVAFAAGVYVFFLGMFLGGLAGLYGRGFFVALPLALIAAGARPLFRYLRRAARHLRAARRRAGPPPWLSVLANGFGLLGLLLVYLTILAPNNVAFDSRWQHLGIAEHYAALGAVRRFPEGWTIGAGPHLASFLYTWAFLLPKGTIADRIEVAAHLEFAVFAIGLVGISALTRRLLARAGSSPRASAGRAAWAARFLFPGIFLYDSSLCLGADHIASVFAAPIYLLFLRAFQDLAPRAAALLALVLAGALLTKWTGALLLVAPILLAVPLRALILSVAAIRRRAPWRRVWEGPLVATVTGLVLSAPHWLKNLVWYGDPLYPILHRTFHPRPWTADSAARFDIGFMKLLWRPEPGWKGVKATLEALLTFSFHPNDWGNFHGQTPVFGSLFTLCLLVLPLLKGTRRLFGLYAATHVGILVWFVTNHQDRYLQAAVPWMAAATAGVLVLAWRLSLPARIAASALVIFQVVWGADVYFMPAHVYLGAPIKAVTDMLSRTPGKPTPARPTYTDAFIGVGQKLPPKSKLLIHEYHPHLGVGAPTVTDCPLHQGGISYARTPTPRQIFDQLTSYGVTHIAYRAVQPREPDTLAGEIAFLNFAHHFGQSPKQADAWTVAALPKIAPPPGGAPDPVLVYTCGKHEKPGLYHLADLAIPAIAPGARAPRPFAPVGPAADVQTLIPKAQAIAHDAGCPPLGKAFDTAFVKLGQVDPYAIWIRR